MPPASVILEVFPTATDKLFWLRYTRLELELFTVTVKTLQPPDEAHTLIVAVPFAAPRRVTLLPEMLA
jgi:hypothetical protein